MNIMIRRALACFAVLFVGASTAAAACPVIFGCGELVPAVPVITYYGTPVVQTTPGYYFGPAAPKLAGKPVYVHPKFYVPGQPLRNAVRAVTP